MTQLEQSGSFSIAGVRPIHRLGYGAMRITGPGIWGPPKDKQAVIRLLRRLPELGVDFIDTADSYGPEVSENLICEALHPYENLLIATKAGLTRAGPNRWTPKGDPEYLIAAAKRSRERLKIDTIALWQLHRIDPHVPRAEQFAAIRTLLDSGVIAQAGLSEVSVEEIEAARKVFPVATVQNRYNLDDRGSDAVLDYCEKHAIGFIPWYPLAAGDLAEPGGALQRIAAAHKVTPPAIALAWLLKRSPVLLPIPGTASLAHLEENMAAAGVRLSQAEFDELAHKKPA